MEKKEKFRLYIIAVLAAGGFAIPTAASIDVGDYGFFKMVIVSIAIGAALILMIK